MFNLSIEQAQLIQAKTEEIKNTLDQEFITHSSSDDTIHITVSITGNVKEIRIPQNVDINSSLQTLNDHISLRDQDVTHSGYKKYDSMKRDLIKRNPKYKQTFDASLKHYEKNYKNYKKK